MSPEEQRLRGNVQPCRQVVALFPDEASRPDPDHLPPPKGMSAAARKIWVEKVERYRQRGQKVQGREDALQAYCETQAKLFKLFRTQAGPSIGMINAHRAWCNEFHDTPASQKTKAGDGTPSGNPFAANVRRPAAPSPAS